MRRATNPFSRNGRDIKQPRSLKLHGSGAFGAANLCHICPHVVEFPIRLLAVTTCLPAAIASITKAFEAIAVNQFDDDIDVYAVALPIGAWLGFEYGWHTPVWLCTAASLAALIAASVLLPKGVVTQSASFSGFKAAARQSAVLRVWLRTLLFFIAIFSVFAYIGPVLLALNAMSPLQLSGVLAVFGMAGVAGTLLGGWANDRFGALRTMRLQLAVLASMMGLLPFTQGYLLATVGALVVWGVAGFGLTAPQQSRLVSLSPGQAPLLLSLNSSMLYLGTALGAVISGALIDSVGLPNLGWVGAPFRLAALATLWFDRVPA